MAGRDFDEFFAANYDSVARTLTVVTGDRELAEDRQLAERALRAARAAAPPIAPALPLSR